MANRAFLIGATDATPLDPTTESPGAEVLCGASYLVPAFWLFCFNESDKCELSVELESYPTAITSTVAARARLSKRAALVTEVFAAHVKRWEEWVGFIEECAFPYLHLEGYEIWAMDPEDYAHNLPQALRWFDSGSVTDRDALFRLASIKGYDAGKGAVICDSEESPGLYLQGYSWMRPVPWDEDAVD